MPDRTTSASKDFTAASGFEATRWLAADAKRGFRDRRQQTLFIDARKPGTHIDRVHRELTDADLERITRTYSAWRGAVGVRASARQTPAAGERYGLKPELQP